MGEPTRTGCRVRGRVPSSAPSLAAWVLAVALVVAGALVLVRPHAALLAPAAPAATSELPVAANAAAGSSAARTGPAGGESSAVAATGTQVRAGAIRAAWDGPATHLDWRGRGYATAEATFIGDRTAVPGDRVQRTLDIANDGPSGAVMTVSVVADQTIPETASNPDLARDITLFWDVGGQAGQDSVAGLLSAPAATTQVAQVSVPRGGTVPITAGFAMDRGVTAGRNGGVDSTVLTFTVVVELRGDTDAAGPGLALTGADASGPAGLALGVGGIGLLLILARRRRCADCGRTIRRRERWRLLRLPGGMRRTPCAGCADLGPGALPAGS